MKQQHYPTGWNEERTRKVLQHYERQTEEEAVAEDEAALRQRDQTVMVVPNRLVPTITRLIAKAGQREQSAPDGLTNALHRIAARVRILLNPKSLVWAARGDRRR